MQDIPRFVLTSFVQLTSSGYSGNMGGQHIRRTKRMDVKRLLIICLLPLFLLSLNAFGVKNVSQSGQFSLRPTIAINKDGMVMVVWLEQPLEKDYGTIYYRTKIGGNWSSAKNAGVTWKAAWTPMLSVDAEGNFHMAWSDGFSSQAREIYYSMYKTSSGAWTAREMVYWSPNNSSWPKIDVKEGRIYIGWAHRHEGTWEGGDIVTISKRISDANWPNSYERISFTANDICNHPACKARDDVLYLSYMEGSGETGPWNLRFKHAKRGSNWSTVHQATLDPNGYYPELTVDHNDDPHVVWSSRRGAFYYRTRKGGSWKATEIISNFFAPRQMGDIRYRNGILVSTFVQETVGGREAYYTVKTLQGEWSKPTLLADGTDARHPKVWIDDNANAHIVWQDISGGHTDVFYEQVAVPSPDPFIQASPESLSFIIEGVNPEPTSLFLKNIGQDPLDYTVKVNQDWLSVAPISGKLKEGEEDELQVTINAIDLDEGTYTAAIQITSPQAVNSPRDVGVTLEVLAPPIFPPLNFAGEVMENSGLFYTEYMHRLTWEPNPQNRDIELYRIYYREGENYVYLDELPSSTLEYTRRNIKANKTFTYELWAVDDKGRTGDEPATLTIGGTTSTIRKDTSKKSFR
jgi:hypothetical protein